MMGGGAGFMGSSAGGYGSTGGITLSSPIIGMTATATGDGYWLTSADGSVYSFGAAEPLGVLTGLHLAAPIIGLTANPARPTV